MRRLLLWVLLASAAHGAAPPVQRWYSGSLTSLHVPPLTVRVDILAAQVYVREGGHTVQQAKVHVSFNHRSRAIRIQFSEVSSDCSLSGHTDTLTGVLNQTSGRIQGSFRSADGPDAFSGTFTLRPATPVSGPITCQAPVDRPIT